MGHKCIKYSIIHNYLIIWICQESNVKASCSWYISHKVPPMLGFSADNSTTGNGFDINCSFAGDHKAEKGKTIQTNVKCTIGLEVYYSILIF